MQGLGAIAPGYRADCAVLPDLERFAPRDVVKGGRPVVRAGAPAAVPRAPVPVWVRQSVRAAPLEPERLRIPAGGGEVRVIGVIPDQLLTDALVERPTVRDGAVVADPERDLAKIAVIERHHATGRVGVGLVRGFGLRRGALATTVAHDAHNIVVVGVDDRDMVLAAGRLGEIGGGIVVCRHGDVLEELPLPVAGLMSDQPAERVVERLDAIGWVLGEAGVTLSSPLMALSFLALSVIPALKITDRGLIDVEASRVVPLEVG
jgi:adenine deaminase